MPKVSLTSLRSRAIILVLISFLPLLALILYAYVDKRQQAIREVQRDELVAARNLAAIQELLINNTRQLLATLAQSPPVQCRDRTACDGLFRRVMEQCPYYDVLGAANPEGIVFASFPESKESFDVNHRLWFQKAVQTREFFVGEPLLGRISHKYSIIMSYPVINSQGRLQCVIYAGIDLHWLGGLLAKSDFPSSCALVLSDASSKVLFRYPEPLKYLGMKLPESLAKAMSAHDEGVAEGVGLPGDARLFAFARLSPPWQEMRVAIGLPRKWAVGPVNRELQRNLIYLGLVGILSLAAAWFGTGLFIMKPVKELREVTQKLAAGDLTGRAGPEYSAGELGLLARDFDRMADALAARDQELKTNAEELRQRIRDLDRRTVELETANKEMEAFTYSVSHDLRAPLRSMGGFARVLLEEYPDKLDAEGKRYLHIIHQEAHKMGRLIDDLLTLTRLGRKEMALGAIDMARLAGEVFEELEKQYPGRRLQIEIQSLPAALGDRAMIRQVLVNLLDNAIKFTAPRDPALIQVSGWSEGGENVYGVKDNGVGFDMKYVNKLFEVFQQLHRDAEFSGTGIGLAMVKRIIDRHGGRVWAEGEVDAGAAIYFTIPR